MDLVERTCEKISELHPIPNHPTSLSQASTQPAGASHIVVEIRAAKTADGTLAKQACPAGYECRSGACWWFTCSSADSASGTLVA